MHPSLTFHHLLERVDLGLGELGREFFSQIVEGVVVGGQDDVLSLGFG